MHDPRFDVEVVTRMDDIPRVRDAWSQLCTHPHADPDFFAAIVSARPEVVRPHLVLLSAGGQPRAMLVGRVEDVRMDGRLGYLKLARPRLRRLEVVHGGVMGEIGAEESGALWAELARVLKSGEIGAVHFGPLRRESGLVECARRKAAILLRERAVRPDPHWTLQLPASLAEFLERRPSKHRYWLKRIGKVLERDFPGRVRHRNVSAPAEVDELCAHMERVAQRTYQRGIGAGFFDNAENRRRYLLCAERGWLRAYLVYVDDQPRAFWSGTLYRGTFHLDFTGFEPELRKYEPGTIVFLRMVEDLCAAGVREVDFGLGSAAYKERFGDRAWDDLSFHIFAPGIRGLALNAVTSASNVVARASHWVLERADLVDRIKRSWRRSLAPAGGSETPKTD